MSQKYCEIITYNIVISKLCDIFFVQPVHQNVEIKLNIYN